MLQRAGGSLAGVEDGGLEGEGRGGGGQERVAYVGGCRGGGGGGARMMVDVIVCVLGGGVTHNPLSQHPNIMLVKKNNARDCGSRRVCPCGFWSCGSVSKLNK